MSDINPSDKAPLTCTFTVRVRMHGVEGDLQIAGGTLKQIRDAVGQLRDIRGIELVSEPRAWTTLPDGTPLCPKHNVPMRKREKQGDEWWSHNVGTEDAPVYCKGYAGKDSPGWDYEERTRAEAGSSRRGGAGRG